MNFREFIENTEKPMMIRIKDTITRKPFSNTNYYKMLGSLAGQWIPVDTKHLFDRQFNAIAPEGLIGVDIADVNDVQNDARIMAAKCGWCGTTFLNVSDEHLGQPCPKCNAYPMRDEAIIDRIRPLQTMENGQHKVIHPKLRRTTIKTPEGEVYKNI